MAAAEGEAERRADSEGRITDTRTEAGDPEVTDKEEVEAGAVVEGVYIYPDWSSCVRGEWSGHMLVQGELFI